VAEALRGSESIEGGSPRAEKEAEEETSRGNSPRLSVELADTLPAVPQGRRVACKRKTQEIESSRYEHAALLSYTNIVAC
jgi:hypothetical protein